MSLLIRRGTDAERQTITPLEGEFIYTTDLLQVWIGDNTTVGGNLVTGVTGSLQDVTDVGNSTTNDIEFGPGAGILLDNGARVREGTTDSGLGGSGGVALRCSIDYELKWEAGRLFVMEQDGFTIRAVFYNFTSVPTSAEDDTLGFQVDSRWVLDNGDTYICSDNTTGAAVWYLEQPEGLTFAIATGTDTYSTTIPGVSSYNDGDAYLIRFENGNTTGSTLEINGLGAIDLYRNNNGQIIGGDIHDDSDMLITYHAVSPPYFACIGTSPNALYAYVHNSEAITINRGEPVYAFGAVGDRMAVKLAYNTTDATSAQTVGLVYSNSIAAGQKGFIIIQGVLDKLNLGSYTDGDPVYLGATAGTLTKTKPSAPNHLVYLGVVERANAGNGTMYVRVQNGFELAEIHDVSIVSPVDGDIIQYNSITSLWENGALPASGVSTVTATAPLTSSGGTSPDISTSIATNRLVGRTTAGTGVMEQLTPGNGILLSGGSVSNSFTAGQIFIELNGQGGVIQAPSYTGVSNITFNGTITGWTIFSQNPSTGAALSGSVSVDIWVTTAGTVPTVANTIFSGTKPNLSSQSYNSATGLSINLTAGQTIMAKVESATTCVLVNLQLQITRTA